MNSSESLVVVVPDTAVSQAMIDQSVVTLTDHPVEGMSPQQQSLRRVAYWAQEITRHGQPVVILASDTYAPLLPSLAFALRSAHIPVHGYVLVDALPLAPSPDFPDAPVWWVVSTAANDEVRSKELAASLRGYRVHTGDQALQIAILEATE